MKVGDYTNVRSLPGGLQVGDEQKVLERREQIGVVKNCFALDVRS